MIKLKDLLEGKNYNSPGYENRQFGDPLPTLEDITKKYQESKEDVNEKAFSSSIIAKAIKVAKSMGGNMTAAVKKIEKMEKGLSKNGRVEFALQKANESVKVEGVNESISAFDVDFYKDTSNRQTSHKEIVRGDKFSDVISKITKVAKSKEMNYAELYYKNAFIGSINKKNSFKFKKGRNHQKSPLSVNEGQKKQASVILRKFDMAYIKFSQEVRDVMKLMDKSTGSKVDGKIINKAYGKHLIPFDDLMQSWAKGQQENPGLDEAYDIWMEDGSFGGTFTGLVEAEYQGRKVKLGKPMQGDSKKFKVYVKNPKGNVVKVNFGQGGDAKGGTMRIRKSNPKARANFRARHNCDSPGPKHKARYWSCKKW